MPAALRIWQGAPRLASGVTMGSQSSNVTWHAGQLSPAARARVTGQPGAVVWMTGLSGSGKSTLAVALERHLVSQGQLAFVLDGDNVRHGLNGDLGFSPADRVENIRRVAHVAGLMADAGVLTLVSFISPYRAERARAATLIGPQRFVEVYVATPLAVCEARDPKGLYARARRGEIRDFTGLDAPYEAPLTAAIEVSTADAPLSVTVQTVVGRLRALGHLPRTASA